MLVVMLVKKTRRLNMMILGENYDEYFGLDEYDPYDPCEGYEDEWDNEELEVIEELNEIFNL